MKTHIKFFAAVAAVFLLSGCASQAVSTLTPSPGKTQESSALSVKAECTGEAMELMPKSLGFLEVIPVTTYGAVYNAFAACTQKHGYDTQCHSNDKFLCGMNIIGFQ